MLPRSIAAIAALTASALLSTLAQADVRSDAFTGMERDATLWTEIESYRNTLALRDKVAILQDGDRLRIDGLGGKGGGAAYVGTYKVDWNDGFRVRFGAQLESFVATLPGQSAVMGLSLGFDAAFSVVRGHRNAIVVEIEATEAGTTVQLAWRKGNLTLAASPKMALAEGWHDFEFELLANAPDSTITMNLYADGDSAPLAAIPAFAGPVGFDTKGVKPAIFGIARGTPRFAASFDDFQFEGDLYSDADDASWEDFDDHRDGPAGDRNESVDAYQLRSAFYTAVYESVWAYETIIAAEVRDGAIVFVFRDSATTVHVVKASVVDQSLIESFTRTARLDERIAMASVWNGASVAGADVADYLLHANPGSMFLKGSLNMKASPRRWDVRMLLPEGDTAILGVAADGNTGGDGVTSLAPMRFSGAIITAYDAYTAGQGHVIGAAMVNGTLEVVFVHPTVVDAVRVVRINPRTLRAAGGLTRAATPSELFAIEHAPQYGVSEAIWAISMDYGGAPVMNWAIVDLGGGAVGTHAQLRYDSGEVVDDVR